ncbi:glycosyltransferase [Alkalihalobacterium alkalinitrilicum]|uniref:glycosyltransferase n=1 Tax=Alkalihalobacterium alkalinitrilicum TaxID=427920 RepID=UPI0009958012|nr:glycosyltransferase [Alkalihalobacterium alkalinitrilicum]
MKKNILFVMNNLNCGGAEKALISLLETIDYSLYNVDLYLFKHEGIFFNKIPNKVKLLKEPTEYKFFDMPIKTALINLIKQGKINSAVSRVRAGYIFNTENNRAQCEQRVWKHLSNSLSPVNKEYDVAIGYLEKNPIYFCVDKVQAKKKIGFIHNDYIKLGMDPSIDLHYFNKLDKIVTVSNECADVLKQEFPMYQGKIDVMFNIISPNVIHKMSKEKVYLKDKILKIVSVGRLNYQKGYELAIEACNYLVKNGFQFKWFVIGEGEERTNLESLIRANNLDESFILLGLKENPYPYIKEADIYVQTSRFEGKSIAIDEAKILQKPILVTNFSTAKDQINHGENGLIVEMNGSSIAEGIQKLIKDQGLRNKLIANLSKEKLGTEEEIEKLYDFINAG